MCRNYLFSFNKMQYFTQKESITGCILCHISKHDHKCEELVLWENEYFIISLNLYPYNPGHLIIFPKRHIEDFRKFSETEIMQINRITKACLNLLDETYHPAGYNIGYNMGLCAGASIEHIHQHIVPRYKNEIGIEEIIGGSRILVESPRESHKRLLDTISEKHIFT
ncbi:HIT domain-containing protein [Spirochaetia bacterium 38H-sp]|uniref:HIT domain-containing protein n=1 Tax=Rarispira pelagica TaxID=3141764 RepID=A0ABU9UAR5_9SPIR